MREPRHLVPTVVLLLLSLAVCSSGLSPEEEAAAEISGQIERTVQALTEQRNEGDAGDGEAQIERLQEMTAGNRGTLLQQMALFLRDSTSTREAMGGAVLLEQLDFSMDEKLQGILPELEGAEPKLRRTYLDLLSPIDRPEGEADFTPYEPHIKDMAYPLQDTLILYMYEISPGAALRTMTRSLSQGDTTEIAVSEETIRLLLENRNLGHDFSSGARAEFWRRLDGLSRHPDWWVRLYAAVTVQAETDTEAKPIKERLQDDGHPLVRGVMSGPAEPRVAP